MGNSILAQVAFVGLCFLGSEDVDRESLLEYSGPTDLLVQMEGFYETGKYGRALLGAEVFLSEYEEDPRAKRARYIRGATLLRLKQREEGLEALEAAVAEDPSLKEQLETQALLAEALSGKPDRRVEAAGYFRKVARALEKQGENDGAAIAWTKLGQLYMDYERWPAGPDGQKPTTRAERKAVQRALALEALGHAIGLDPVPWVYGQAELLRGRVLAGQVILAPWDIDGALTAYQNVLERAGRTTIVEEAFFESAFILEMHKSNYWEAERRYQRMMELFPDSEHWEEAKERLADIRRPMLALRSEGSVLPGEEPALHWRARNVREVVLKAYKVELLGALKGVGGPEKLHQLKPVGEPAAEWQAKIPDDGKHRYLSSEEVSGSAIGVPIREAGAYVIKAEGGGAASSVLVVISNLVAAAKSAGGGMAIWVADRVSGKPVVGADVVVQWVEGPKGVLSERGKTDQWGVWRFGGATGGRRVRAGRWMSAFVRRGDDYAVVSQATLRPWVAYPRPLRVFGFTDGGIYRRGEVVHFKEVVRTYNRGVYGNWVGSELKVRIRGPKGEVVDEQVLVTNGFGAVSGSYRVGADVVAGIYRIEVVIGSGTFGSELTGGNAFRVVSCEGSGLSVKVSGEPAGEDGVGVVIEAADSSGKPAADAKVAYEVWARPAAGLSDGSDGQAWYGDLLEEVASGSNQGVSAFRLAGGEAVTDENGRALVRVDGMGGAMLGASALSWVGWAQAVDEAGRAGRGMGVVWKGGAGSGEDSAGGVDLILKKRVYKPGDKAEVVVRSGQADAVVWLTAESNQLLYSRVAQLRGGEGKVEVPIDERYGPNCYVCAMGLGKGGLVEDREGILVPPSKGILGVKIGAEKAAFLPGESAELEIQVQDDAGRPGAASVAVYLVDKRVAVEGGRWRPRVEAFFHGDLRPVLMRTRWEHAYFGGWESARGSKSEAAMKGKGGEKGAVGKGAETIVGPLPSGCEFASSGVWVAETVTDADGVAKISVTLPQAAARWQVVAVAIDQRTQVGEAAIDVVTK